MSFWEIAKKEDMHQLQSDVQQFKYEFQHELQNELQNQIQTEVVDLQGQMQNEIQMLKNQMQIGIVELQKQLQTGVLELQKQMQKENEDLKRHMQKENDDLRRQMQKENDELRKQMQTDVESMKKQMNEVMNLGIKEEMLVELKNALFVEVGKINLEVIRTQEKTNQVHISVEEMTTSLSTEVKNMQQITKDMFLEMQTKMLELQEKGMAENKVRMETMKTDVKDMEILLKAITLHNLGDKMQQVMAMEHDMMVKRTQDDQRLHTQDAQNTEVQNPQATQQDLKAMQTRDMIETLKAKNNMKLMERQTQGRVQPAIPQPQAPMKPNTPPTSSNMGSE